MENEEQIDEKLKGSKFGNVEELAEFNVHATGMLYSLCDYKMLNRQWKKYE